MSKYNLELLKSEADKFGFKLIGEYEKLNQSSKIKGTCITEGCDGTFEKNFCNLYIYQSPYCRKCVKKISTTKQGTSNMKKYGVKSTAQIPSVKKKMEKTNLEKFGSKSPMQNKIIKEKVQNTMMQRYGVKHNMQHPELANKQLEASFKLKEFTLPSGKVLKLQGFEHFCLYDLLNKEGIKEEDIITSRIDVPELWYRDENNTEHRHYVDFFVKSLNKCIEVKSEWTIRKEKKDKIYLKQKAAIELGYEYEIRVYSPKGKLLQSYY